MFFLCIGGGIVAVLTQPLQNYLYRRSAVSTQSGRPHPEARLHTACVAVWVMTISIFWFAFTCELDSAKVSYQVPMWSGLLFGYARLPYTLDCGNMEQMRMAGMQARRWRLLNLQPTALLRAWCARPYLFPERGQQVDTGDSGICQPYISGGAAVAGLEGSVIEEEDSFRLEL